MDRNQDGVVTIDEFLETCQKVGSIKARNPCVPAQPVPSSAQTPTSTCTVSPVLTPALPAPAHPQPSQATTRSPLSGPRQRGQTRSPEDRVTQWEGAWSAPPGIVANRPLQSTFRGQDAGPPPASLPSAALAASGWVAVVYQWVNISQTDWPSDPGAGHRLYITGSSFIQ